jgi:ferric-dicitrate binding protein FerR (iron transport regulator)
MTNYKDYTVEQYLNDELFIRSVLEPTNETRSFWGALIDSGALDIYTYTDAVLILNGWKNGNAAICEEDLDNLWLRIEKDSAQKTRRGIRWKAFTLTMAGVAAVLATLFFILPRLKTEKEDKISVAPGYVLITQAQKSDKVVIYSNQEEILLEGSDPEVRYDTKGQLQLTQTTSDTPQETENDQPSQSLADVGFSQIIVPYGKMASLVLSDGSNLRLNAGTTVQYPKAFDGDRREIIVDGEVYAEIAKDNRPFIIHTNTIDVKVKGTRFNLSSYSTDEYSQVVLVSGSVDVSHEGGLVSLMPRQAFTITPDNSSVQLVNPDLYTSWTKGMLRFEDESLENVLVKLARFYNVSLVLPDKPSGVICYGSLELKEDLTTILYGLTEIASFNFVVRDNAFVVHWLSP